jgi:hypothetical protein
MRLNYGEHCRSQFIQAEWSSQSAAGATPVLQTLVLVEPRSDSTLRMEHAVAFHPGKTAITNLQHRIIVSGCIEPRCSCLIGVLAGAPCSAIAGRLHRGACRQAPDANTMYEY